MKLLSDSRRLRKFIIWLERLGARGAAGPDGAEDETEAAATGGLRWLRRLRPGSRRAIPADSRGALGRAGRAARGAAPGSGRGPEAELLFAPPLSAEPAPPPIRCLRAPHLAVGSLFWRFGGRGFARSPAT